VSICAFRERYAENGLEEAHDVAAGLRREAACEHRARNSFNDVSHHVLDPALTKGLVRTNSIKPKSCSARGVPE
jgi:hypothetical protein